MVEIAKKIIIIITRSVAVRYLEHSLIEMSFAFLQQFIIPFDKFPLK